MPRCAICKSQFKPRVSSFQKTCEKPECLAEYWSKIVKKQQAKRGKEIIAELKEKHKDGPYYKAKLQDEMNFIARLIDAGTNCRSCNSPITKINIAQGGHFWSKGGYPNLRFLLANIHLQGVCCNKHKGGNLTGYYEGLQVEYGDSFANYVRDEIRALYPSIQLSLPELKEKYKIAIDIRKELQKIGMQYPPQLRIELRKKYDERLGIYS